ncbi:hypothetical protein APA_4205 [Pseudanabaena sp. lw0831]|uniref:hypothetical protein n=1 Tax=Pseudanabaena sp. lw0831 TaxID=1357935 RepID=UPI0019159FA4|nr:hypothetical protein [Pseudanabaena sp. lw0831]GBO55999.1 hypothetical protein APA_4205 [Pseudanabaena sp. lw0831]
MITEIAISSQIKQRSPILPDTINVQSDRHLIPKNNDRNSYQTKQQSLFLSDTLNVLNDRVLFPQNSDHNSSQIK